MESKLATWIWGMIEVMNRIWKESTRWLAEFWSGLKLEKIQ